ncbi:1,4-alpha-glucan branching protein GlgB [Ruminococcus bromii]|nr:1,4-alpha-glucan branching protein GlgB [Ruminococcus bromii]MTQ93205.1 1,4-alpha-glucan branching protein GlgB [Ruminococcus bromii]MTR78526.1 1,4-alpha-glucan branching protein GlgB [Ruminococcus bromii]MTR87381.1 1,4-alpha-glucan branching protein GlgB [Ruminococcus bromii]
MNYSFNEARPALEVFHTGDSVRAYDFLGAHLVNRNDKNGVVFRVWAPTARSVSVAGDFNNWNNEANYMYDIGYGVWEVFVEGVKQFCTYKYCIESEYGDRLMKADPYAFHAQTRPGQASVVYDIESYSWNDSEWFNKRKENNISSSPMNIYEIHAGSWRKYPDGNFFNYQKLADELIPYLKEMHYTHVQLMPIMEYPYDGSWGFQTTGYYAPTSRYGTPSDFMAFVDKLHGEGIGVILDWVPSNFPTDDFGLARFDGSPLYESNDPKTSKRDSWGTCLFNYARFEVTSFLVSCAMFWLDKYHIDGLRIGALSSMLYLDYGKTEGEWEPNKFGGKENLDAVDFVKRLNTAVHMYHPDVMMFAEENTSWPKLTHKIEDGGLGFDFKWNMGWMNDMLHYMSLNPMWRPFNHDSLTFSFYYAFSEKFLLPISHDEVSHGKGSLIKQMPGKYDEQFAGVRAFITYMYAHPGKKLVFMGTEIGQFDEWNHEEAIQWDLLEFEKHKKLRTFFKELNKFYLDCKPLYELDTVWKGFDWIHHDDYTNSVIAFKRTDKKGDEIVSVCNFQPIRRDEYCIGVPKYGLYDEVFNSDEERFGGSGVVNGNNIKTEVMKIHGFDQGLSLTLPPLSVIYLRCTKELEPDEVQKEN